MKREIDRLARRSLASVLGIVGIAACAASTEAPPETTHEAERPSATVTSGYHARPADPGTQLYKIEGSEPNAAPIPLLVSNGRGYRLTCPSTVGLVNLITGAGFDPNGTQFLPVLPLTDTFLQQLVHHEQVTLADFGEIRCNQEQASLISIDIENDRKYFLNLRDFDDTRQKFILRNVGCAELLRAMSLDLRAAIPMDPQLAQRDYIIDDAYDIHCAQGTTPSAFVPKIRASSEFQIAGRGNAIGAITFTLENVAPNETATLVPKSDECGFLTISGTVVSGVVTPTFPKRTCSTSIVAKGRDFETLPVKLTFDFVCEIDSTDNCGRCGTVCPVPTNTTPLCASVDSQFSCKSTCKLGYADCNTQMTDGCETPLDTLQNCGACGVTCGGKPNTDATCNAGSCRTQCKPGFIDCDGNPDNGCEANLASVNSCGGCGNVCPGSPNGAPQCVLSETTQKFACATICMAPFEECDGNKLNGCEANLSSTSSCGACGRVCNAGPHAVATCTSGVCGTVCEPGFYDCDGNPSNGCEANLNSIATCGGCGAANRCATGGNMSTTCSGGNCGYACNWGTSNCDGNLWNGCEVATGSDVNNCGGCGVRCGAGAHQSARCTNGGCRAVCQSGWGDCNANPGCETNLNSNTNCGSCGRRCAAGQVCSGGDCIVADDDPLPPVCRVKPWLPQCGLEP